MGLLRFFGYDGSAYEVFRDASAYVAQGDPVKAWEFLRTKMSMFTMANYMTFFLLVGTLAMSVWQARRKAVSHEVLIWDLNTRDRGLDRRFCCESLIT